uniref:Tc1-like transposase DDE domain-containing protein n=1 Tax=Mycena chlorophos TaxID=658473 RepID=A0ABQ0M130_MYCCL|nr:predicted protein [Mycena chlorophos]
MTVLDTPTKRACIVALKDANTPNTKIQAKVGGSVCQINRIYKKWKGKTSFYGRTPERGRKAILTDRDVRHSLHSSYPFASSSPGSIPISTRTHSVDNFTRPAAVDRRRNVPLITKKNHMKQWNLGRDHRDWTPEMWRHAQFADESLYTVFKVRGIEWCWRRPGEALDPHNTTKTVKHDGRKVAVCGVMTSDGLDRLVRIEGNLNAPLLRDIMEDNYLGSLTDLKISRKDAIYMHDNNCKHKSKLVQRWFAEKNISQVEWPPSSPDINIQEHV